MALSLAESFINIIHTLYIYRPGLGFLLAAIFANFSSLSFFIT